MRNPMLASCLAWFALVPGAAQESLEGWGSPVLDGEVRDDEWASAAHGAEHPRALGLRHNVANIRAAAPQRAGLRGPRRPALTSVIP